MDPSLDDFLTLNRVATVARLVSGAIHEVNNALQVISGNVELIAGAPDVPDHVRIALARISAQSARAAAAMAGVTELARPHAGTRGRVDLRQVVARAGALRRYAIGRAGLTLAIDAGDQPLFVTGVAAHLLQAIVNLIDNAEQAMAASGTGQVAVSAVPEGVFARVDVSDDGPGLAPAVGDRAFEPFVTSKPRKDSLGLGLAVARAIAEAHGGTLLCDPRTHGTAFVLRVPLVADSR